MIRQKHKTPTCGQCCLATILNITYKEAIDLIGHEKATKSKELIKHFNYGSIKRGLPQYDALCMLKFKENPKRNWHWIVKLGNDIYDPLRGKLINIDEYFKKYHWMKVTSHFKINKK